MKRRLVLALMLFMFCFCGTLQQAAAFNPLPNEVCGGNGAGAAVCNGSGGNPLSGNKGVILKIANIVAYLGGLAAIIVFIIGGFRYVISRGDAGSVASAKTTMIYALIGLVIIALAKTIIGYVISKI